MRPDEPLRFRRSGTQHRRVAVRVKTVPPNAADALAAILTALNRIGPTPTISCSA